VPVRSWNRHHQRRGRALELIARHHRCSSPRHAAGDSVRVLPSTNGRVQQHCACIDGLFVVVVVVVVVGVVVVHVLPLAQPPPPPFLLLLQLLLLLLLLLEPLQAGSLVGHADRGEEVERRNFTIGALVEEPGESGLLLEIIWADSIGSG
jgi:cobalamin biosynthesis protein CobD/CbiB